MNNIMPISMGYGLGDLISGLSDLVWLVVGLLLIKWLWMQVMKK